MKGKLKIKLWDIAYSMYFITLFLSDVEIPFNGVNIIIKSVRYVSYALFLLCIFINSKSSARYMRLMLMIVPFSSFLAFFTKDIYYVVIFFIILSSLKQEKSRIIDISYSLLLVFTVIVVSCALIGVIPMVNTSRVNETTLRLGMGFYHSNVFPLILIDLIIFRILKNQGVILVKRIFFWAILISTTYYLCRSKNGLICGMFLCLGTLIFSNIRSKKQKFIKIIRVLANNMVPILTIYSLSFTMVQGRGYRLAYYVNQLSTGRFAIAYHQMQNQGLQLVNIMNANQYWTIARVIDNGYLYVVLRYGLLFIFFYWRIHVLFNKRYIDKPIFLLISIVISFSNMIDNDLYSYGYLPFILLAFNEVSDKILNRSFLDDGSKLKSNNRLLQKISHI